MFSFLKKLFGFSDDNNEKEKAEKKLKEQYEKKLPIIAPQDNTWGVALLDFRSEVAETISVAEDRKQADNAVSYTLKNVQEFWKTPPINPQKATSTLKFALDGTLYPGVLFIPRAMEEKWAIYYNGEDIIFVRSWQREVFVVAKTRQADGYLHIEEITGDFTGETSAEETNAIFNFLMISYVLGEVVPAPLPKDFEQMPHTLAFQLAFKLYGNKAYFGVFDETFISAPHKPLRSDSLLHIAALLGDLATISKLAKEKYDLNAFNRIGYTVLGWAVPSDNSSSLEKLLELGADPNKKFEWGETVLMEAAELNKENALALLLKAGADVNATNDKGFSALHKACEMGHLKIAKLLLANGADKSIEAQGHTALSLAQMAKQTQIIALLTK